MKSIHIAVAFCLATASIQIFGPKLHLIDLRENDVLIAKDDKSRSLGFVEHDQKVPEDHSHAESGKNDTHFFTYLDLPRDQKIQKNRTELTLNSPNSILVMSTRKPTPPSLLASSKSEQQNTDRKNKTILKTLLTETPQRISSALKRTAVVWTTKGIFYDCEAHVIRHLVKTSPGMDVWALTNPLATLTEEERIKSQSYIRSIPELRQTFQHNASEQIINSINPWYQSYPTRQ